MIETPEHEPLPPPGPAEPIELGGVPESLDRMMEFFREYGDTYRVTLPSRKTPAVVVHHPEDVKRVLITNSVNYTKGIGLDRVKILLGNGIMVSEGDHWKRQRRMLQPAFHRRALQHFEELIRGYNGRHLETWSEAAAKGEAIDVAEEMSRLALEIILRAIFSQDLDYLTRTMGVNPFSLVSEDSARNLEFAMKFRSLRKLVREIVENRRREGREPHDFLSMVVGAEDEATGERMSEREWLDETMTLIVAGHETTASSLTWAWYLLALNPDVEARLHEEVDSVLEPGEVPPFDRLKDLPYTDLVLKEALRMYPPGWLLTRRAVAEDHLGGFRIAPGTDVLVSPYVVHRHPSFWSDPEAFRPERFTGEEERARNRFIYFPFGLGPRRCIGEPMANFEMQVHLAATARRFRLVRDDDRPVEMEAAINLRPKGELRMRVENRG